LGKTECWYVIQADPGSYLTDGRLEFSNNRAERAIKELVVVRKNWLFHQFQRAQASGIIIGVIRTAEANGLDTHVY
jgi:hypothetical protein